MSTRFVAFKDKSTHNEYHRNRRLKARIEIMAFLGNKCATCGFTDHRALQIDHKNGGGTIEWEHGSMAYDKRYAMIKANPDNYQILCANCNWIKRYENGELPHSR